MLREVSLEQSVVDLRKSLAWLDLVISTINDGIISLDKDLKIHFINDRAAEILRRDRIFLLGAPIWQALPLFKKNNRLKKADYLLHANKPSIRSLNDIYELSTGDNKILASVKFNRVPKINQISLTITDVTEQKRAEEDRIQLIQAQLEGERLNRHIAAREILERQKNNFIALASHELRTPLTTLIIFTQVLQKHFRQKKDTVSLKNLAVMDRQITKLTALVNGLLEISSVQAGKLRLKVRLFDLGRLVKETVKTIQRQSPSHELKISGNLQQKIRGDRDRIGQVLTSLISNAVKYSPQSKPIVISINKKQSFAEICISDLGIGIAEKDHQKIFERFYQVAGSKEQTYPGLGMGLFIATEIIKRHGGLIWVESKPSKGSSFYFTLPLRTNKMEKV
jgi:signal transduction histidine kinase